MPQSSPQAVPLYDSFAEYDRFVNWERRLAYELPFLERQLAVVGAKRVLDVACGTGKHSIALGQRGYEVTGVDLSVAMVERARANAALRQAADAAHAGRTDFVRPMSGPTSSPGVGAVRFVVAGFGLLAARLEGGFDAVLCLGNSLPHVLTEEALHTTLDDMAAVLRPGGLLLIQNRNMDAVLERRARWMPVQARREGSREWLFVRFYDFNGDGSLTFNVITLERSHSDGPTHSDGPWVQRAEATRLYPWRHDQLVEAVTRAGFGDVRCYGDMAGAPYDLESSGNLVLVARQGTLEVSQDVTPLRALEGERRLLDEGE